ncbi:MAG: translation elongation factor Ts [Clostridia bacterium]|nr:translation elongation factor Ts [Clostridia bacterium]MDE6758635.1 translation elongation factor Ts [Clostridia bacterium]MDE7078736.1 translation elongation factor Ts [Clostridia bacterium]
MAFTNKDVMDLRAKTGVGMMDCKKALIEADGDMEKAVELLREKGMATSAKRAGKIASQGTVEAYNDGKYGVLVEVNCESDFVARGDQFKAFVLDVAKYIASNNVETVEQVSEGMSVALAEAVAKIGEKIAVRRFAKYPVAGNKLESYIHMGGKIGVLVELTANASEELAHDIAMQIAAANPSYVKIAEVPKEEIEKEKEILKAQALNEDKPKPLNIIEKMVEGRINKYYKEVCLLEQPFVKDGDKTIKALLKEAGADVVRFTRFVMGEGLEKKEENLADEVQAQINSAKKA